MSLIKNASLGTKLHASFGLIAVLMVLVSLVIHGALNRLEGVHESTREQMNTSTLQVEREVDHVVWANQLANSLLLSTPFQGQLDPT